MAEKFIDVEATDMGFFDDAIKEKGSRFKCRESAFAATWMKRIKAAVPEDDEEAAPAPAAPAVAPKPVPVVPPAAPAPAAPAVAPAAETEQL